MFTEKGINSRVKDAKFENESELAFILERVDNIYGMISQCHAQRKEKVPYVNAYRTYRAYYKNAALYVTTM